MSGLLAWIARMSSSDPNHELTPVCLAEHRAKAWLQQVRQISADVARFQATWPPLDMVQTPLPEMTWEQLERQLLSLTPPHLVDMTTGWLSGTRKLAETKPPELLLREILCFVSVIQSEDFQGEEGAMP